MLEEKIKNKIQSRNKMIDNLVLFNNKLQTANHEVILTIDANESFQFGNGGVENLISIYNLVDPIACTNSSTNTLDTYQRGSK